MEETVNKTKYAIIALVIVACFTGANDYFEQPEEFARSGKSFTELAPQSSSHTGDSDWLYDLAWAYFEAGNYSDAERYLRKALDARPNMAFLQNSMGDLFMKTGQTDSAAIYYEAALNNHYEYIDAWEKLVELKPEYYANLGLLYSEKSEDNNDLDLLQNADRYLNLYLDQFPEGEYAQQSRTALQRIELQRRQRESRQNLDAGIRSLQAEEARRRAEAKADMEEFRTKKPWIAGFGFYSVNFSDDHYFFANEPDSVIDDSLSMKHYAPNINEFGIMGGYVRGPLIFRAQFHYGSTSSGKNYFWRDPVEFIIDTSWNIDPGTGDTLGVNCVDTSISTKDDIRPKVNSVKTLRLSTVADYNFFYMNPVLLYAGVHADFGVARLDEPEDNFESITIAGAGLGGGIMLQFSDFLFDLSYRRGIVGSSSGGNITLMGIYKF